MEFFIEQVTYKMTQFGIDARCFINGKGHSVQFHFANRRSIVLYCHLKAQKTRSHLLVLPMAQMKAFEWIASTLGVDNL